MKILLIEDDPGLSELLREILKESGHEVQNAHSGADAIQKIQKEKFELIILDYSLPDTNGKSLIENLMSINQSIPPYIVSTGMGDERIAVNMMKLGARDYIVKDINYLELLPKVVLRIEKDVENEFKLREAQESLQKSEINFRELVENAPIGIYRTRKDGTIILANTALAKMLGYHSVEELISFHNCVSGYYYPNDREKFITTIEEKKQIQGFESIWKKANGTIIHVKESARCIFDKQGQVLYYEGMVEDITEQKSAESEIKKLSTAVEQSANTIVITDLKGNIEYTNPRFTKLTGYTAAEAKGQNPRILNAGTQPKEYYTKMWETISSGKIWKGEFHNKTKSGKFFWEHVTITPIENEQGEIINFLAIKEDITAIKESEQRLRTLINNLPDAIFFKDANGAWINANGEGLRLFGLENYDYSGKTDLEIAAEKHTYKEALETCAESDEQAWDKMSTLRINESIPSPDGNPRIYSVTKVPLFNSDGSRNALVVMGRDITDWINKENELIMAKEKAEHSEQSIRLINKELHNKNIFIQTILDNLPIGIALNTINKGEATYMNRKFEEIYGWNKDEITSIAKFFEHVYPNDEYRNKLMERILTDINSGDPHKMHWENIIVTRKDDTTRIINAVNIPLPEQNTMVSTVMDVTELHLIQNDLYLAKEKAEESERLKTSFLQNISHEIRTPMNAIVGFSGMLKKPGITDEKRESYVAIIKNSCNQLLSIVSDILTISSLETKQEKLNLQKVCINTIIVDLIAIFNIQAKSQNIKIFSKQALSDRQSEIYTDSTKLTQVLTNLITNAIKFTHQGYIEFGYNYHKDAPDGISLQYPLLVFYVKDTGIGIKPEQQEKIFERFRQADTSINRKYGGTGLGLSISKGFVELLGGKIWVESEPEKGSSFYFTIPYKPVNDFEMDTVETKSPENKIKILVAEDEEYNFLFLEEILMAFDVEIIHAKNGEECIELFKKHTVNLILMDIKMPVLDGYTAAREIKNLKPDIPIIAQTAYALENEREKYDDSTFDDYITKPIAEEELIKKVKIHLKALN